MKQALKPTKPRMGTPAEEKPLANTNQSTYVEGTIDRIKKALEKQKIEIA